MDSHGQSFHLHFIFTEWKYHFQETSKAAYFRINEAYLWEKKATEDTEKPPTQCPIRKSVWQEQEARLSFGVTFCIAALFTLGTLVSGSWQSAIQLDAESHQLSHLEEESLSLIKMRLWSLPPDAPLRRPGHSHTCRALHLWICFSFSRQAQGICILQ